MRVPTRRHLLSLTAATAAVAAAAGLVQGRSQNKAQDGPRAVATFSIGLQGVASHEQRT